MTVFVSRRSRVLARVALYGGTVLVGLPLAFSQALVRPLRQPVSAGPPAGVEQLALVSDGLRLRAWLLRAPEAGERPAVLVAHGLGDTLESCLGAARVLQRRGHDVLLVDLRGHGGSEGRHTTLGGLESHDVRAGLRLLRERGLAGNGFLLVGYSMGAVASLLAAAEEPAVRGLVVEAPYDSYRDTVAHHAWLYYRIPRWLPLVPLTVAVAEWRAGFDADAVDAVAAAARIPAPILAIVDGGDRRMPEAVVRRVLAAHRGPHQLWVAPGAPHVGASLDPEYWPRVTAFLDRHGL